MANIFQKREIPRLSLPMNWSGCVLKCLGAVEERRRVGSFASTDFRKKAGNPIVQAGVEVVGAVIAKDLVPSRSLQKLRTHPLWTPSL